MPECSVFTLALSISQQQSNPSQYFWAAVRGDNYETKKRKYLNDISREAPKFLAYIEIYNIRDDTQMTQRK